MNSKTKMRPFLILWFGQFVSQIGSGATQFALALWIWERTGEVTPMMLTTVFYFLPRMIVSPVAGALIDRVNRKTLMAAADSVAALITLSIFLLLMSGRLEVWHIYLSAFLSGTFQTLQVPALQASVALLVPKTGYTRASGLLGLSDTLGQIFSPMVAALLYGAVGLYGVLALDALTFLVAITALLSIRFVHTPDVTVSQPQSMLHDMLTGFRYLLSHTTLRLLVAIFFLFNVAVEVWASLLSPLVLARTNGDAHALAAVQVAGSVAAVLGGLCISMLPAPRHLLKWMLVWVGIMGLVTLPMTFGNGLVLWMLAHMGYFVCDVFLAAYYHATWQDAVPMHLQGRVFATRNMLFGSTAVLTPPLLGYIVDHLLEPSLATPRPENALLATWVGTGQGAGIALAFGFGGVLLVAIAIYGLMNRTLQQWDSDHIAPASNDALLVQPFPSEA